MKDHTFIEMMMMIHFVIILTGIAVAYFMNIWVGIAVLIIPNYLMFKFGAFVLDAIYEKERGTMSN